MYQDFDKRLDAGIDDLAPNLVDAVLSQDVCKVESEEELFSELNPVQEKPRKKQSVRSRWLKYASCAAAVLCVCMGFFGVHNAYAVQGKIIVDVNPSVELSVDKSGNVTDVKAVNKDGKAIVKDMKTKKGKVAKVLPKVFDTLKDHGYLNKQKSGMLVSYCYDKKKSSVESTMKDTVSDFSSKDKNCTVICQTFKNDEETQAKAEEKGVSVGKYRFVSTIKETTSDAADVSYSESMEQIVTTLSDSTIAADDVSVYKAGTVATPSTATSSDTSTDSSSTTAKTETSTSTNTTEASDTAKSKTDSDSNTTTSPETPVEPVIEIASAKCNVEGKVAILLSAKAKYSKNFAVIIKDSSGEIIESTVLNRAASRIAVQAIGLVKGESYSITVRGIKAKGAKKFGRITGTFTVTHIKTSARSMNKFKQYVAAPDLVVNIRCTTNVELKDPMVTVTDANGIAYEASVIGSKGRLISISISEPIDDQIYTVEITGVKVEGENNYGSVTAMFGTKKLNNIQ